jgi:hypothetical protein
MMEIIEYRGVRYAEIIRASVSVEKTRFFSPAASSFQFGLLAHKAGYAEPPHYHQEFERSVTDLQQMFVVQRGIVGVQLFDDDGYQLNEVILNPGDAIVLIHGAHAIRVIEDMQCISVKQGPFMGDSFDKVLIEPKS